MQRPADSYTGLPVLLTPFIGRDTEVEEVTQLLAESKLLTVTGAGGSGKTRLAIEVASRCEARGLGPVRWVELAALSRSDLLMPHVAAQLGIPESPGREPIEALRHALEPVRLLVLDNCEHVVDACAELVETLLASDRTLTILATSREALGIDGERAWLLQGLRLDAPTAEPQSAPSDAMQLFVDRAQAVSASFRLTDRNRAAIASICRRLDGLPLGIELAAARIGVLTPEQIAARLDDAFALLTSKSRSALPRHKTLRAAVEWSYRLISPAEQQLLERLSVFTGSFSLDAVEHVCCDDSLARASVLDLLHALVTRSLVSMSESNATARYSLLEVIRQYASDQLAALPGEKHRLQRCHALYYADIAEQARPHLERRRSVELIAELAAERDNLGAALQWSLGGGDRDVGLRLTAALLPFFGWTEAGVWFAEAIKGPRPADSPEWGQVLYGAGFLECVYGDRRKGREMLADAADVLRRARDPVHEAITRTSLARLLSAEDELDAALESAEAAAAIARTLEDSWPLCQAMSNGLGHTHMRLRNYDLAEKYLAEASDRARSDGVNHLGVVAVARTRAAVALERNDLSGATRHSLATIASIQELHDPYQAMRVLLLLERVLHRIGRHAAAARVSGTIQAVHADGILALPDELHLHRQTLDSLRAELGPARFDECATHGEQSSIHQALEFIAGELVASGAGQPGGAELPLPPPAVERSPSLQVFALGGLRIVQEGTRSGITAMHAKPKELLAYLLCHPQGMTREQIALAFWPDASSTQAKNSFHVLLHKLRKAVGRHDLITVSDDRYRISADAGVWFDAIAFERELCGAVKAMPADQSRLEAALALYQGDFLDGTSAGDWCLDVQDRLRTLYVDGLSALADLQLQNREHTAAITTLERLLRKDELREDACRRLMSCLAESGRREQALLVYEKFTARLREELGARPESATVALARRLAT